MAFTIPQIVDLAQISEYLSVVDITERQLLKGGDLNNTYPLLLYMEQSIINYQYGFYPDNPQLPPAAAYLFNLCGRYLFQAEQILGTGTGQIVIPGTGTGATLQARNIEFIVGQVGSPMNAGDTTLVLTYDNIVGGSVNVYLGGTLLPVGSYNDRIAYTILYTSNSVIITFNQGVQDTEIYNVTFLQLIPSGGSQQSSTVPFISTVSVSEITSTTATSGGYNVSDGNSAITAKGVSWATHSSPTILDNITNDGSGIGSFTSSLTGLSSSTTYYVRAYATNAIGTSYGDELSFTTSAALTDYTLSTVSASNYTANKGTTGNVIYALEMVNNTGTGRSITSIAGRLIGINISADVAVSGFKIYRNTNPDLSGSPVLAVSAAVSGTTSFDFNYTGLSIYTGITPKYLVFTVDINASATTGHTLNMNGTTNPVVITYDSSATQTNNQSNVSPIIIVGT